MCFGISSSAQHIVNERFVHQIESLSPFSIIKIYGAAEVWLTQSFEPAVMVAADDGMSLKKINANVLENTLVVSTKGSKDGFNPRIYIGFKYLNELLIDGASQLHIVGSIRLADLTIYLSGAAAVDGPIFVENFNTSITGAGWLNITGTTKKTNIKTSGAAKFSGKDFTADEGKIVATGASKVFVSVKNDIDVIAEGAARVYFYGKDAVLTKSVSGAAGVEFKKD